MYELTRSKPFLLIGLTGVGGYVLWRLFKRVGRPRIVKLIVYPIKSLAGIEVDHIQIGFTGSRYGIFHDRSFILLNEHNNMVTQRTKPKLSLIKPSLHGDQIWLDAPGLETLKINYEPNDDFHATVEFKVWGQDVKGIDCDQTANAWLSMFLGAPTRLIKFMPGMEYRSTSVERDNKTMFDAQYPIVYQDGAPFLLINQSSIDDLNSKLDRSSKVSYRNFRPNILVNTGAPFDEDGWKGVQLGELAFYNVKPCTRCTFTTVIPDKGVKHANGEPLRTLRQYRVKEESKHLYGDSPLFGVNLVAHKEGTLKLEDEINLIME